jgi:hypothetical protein
MGELRALDPLLYPEYEDMLHQESQFVEHFHKLLTESVKPPFAISLDGSWGTGKTTVMQLLQNILAAHFMITTQTLDQLKATGVISEVLDELKTLKYQSFKNENDFLAALEKRIGTHGIAQYKSTIFERCKLTPYPTFWFNPWEYQEAESIVLAFLQRFADDMLSNVGEAVRESLKILGTVGLLSLNVALSALPGAIVPLLETLKDPKNIQDIGELLEKEYEKYKNVIKDIQDDFSKLIHTVSQENHGKPVVIFFDDLDRCLPDKAIQLLEAVKNLFVVPQTEVIFICGIDTRIAKQFIKSHYKDIEETFAINYFRKIFNLTISMPSYGSKEIHTLLVDYIKTLYGWDEHTADRLAKMVSTRGLQAEMVSIRKYLNVIHNFYTFRQFNPGYKFDPENDIVVHLLIVKEVWQPLYERLVKEAMKKREETLSDLVSTLRSQDNDGSGQKLSPEQITFLHNYFVSETYPLHKIKLGKEWLLKYPTLA